MGVNNTNSEAKEENEFFHSRVKYTKTRLKADYFNN
jgi:hypothetical protein